MTARLFTLQLLIVLYASNAFSIYRFQAVKEFEVGGEIAIGFIVADGHEWFTWLHPQGEEEQGKFLELNSLRKQVYKWYAALNPATVSMFKELDFQDNFDALLSRHRKKPILVLKTASDSNVYTLSKNQNSRILKELKEDQVNITLLGKDDVIFPEKPVINIPIKRKVPLPNSLKEGYFQLSTNSYQEIKKNIQEVLIDDPRVQRYWVDLPKNLITDPGEKTASFFTWNEVPYSVQITGKSTLQVINLKTMKLSKTSGLPINFANHINSPIFVQQGSDGVYALFSATNYGANHKTYIACVLQPKITCKEVLLDGDHWRRKVELNGHTIEVGRYKDPKHLQFKTVFMKGEPFGKQPLGMWVSEERNPTINSYRKARKDLSNGSAIPLEYIWEMDKIKPFLPFGKTNSYNAFEDPETGARYISMHVNGIRYKIASTIYSVTAHIIIEVSDDFEDFEF